jgi:hypothetical protein
MWWPQVHSRRGSLRPVRVDAVPYAAADTSVQSTHAPVADTAPSNPSNPSADTVPSNPSADTVLSGVLRRIQQ